MVNRRKKRYRKPGRRTVTRLLGAVCLINGSGEQCPAKFLATYYSCDRILNLMYISSSILVLSGHMKQKSLQNKKKSKLKEVMELSINEERINLEKKIVLQLTH